jgi:hypothetical protein
MTSSRTVMSIYIAAQIRVKYKPRHWKCLCLLIFQFNGRGVNNTYIIYEKLHLKNTVLISRMNEINSKFKNLQKGFSR